METLVLFIPTKFEIYGPLAGPESGERFRAEREGALPFADASRDALATLAREIGVRFVDLVPEFEARAQRGELLYYPFDTHWNPAGRQAAAEVLAREL
jgi:hypothetical protein